MLMSLSKDQVITCVFGFSSYYMACICISVPSPFLPRESESHGQPESITGLMLGWVSLIGIFSTPLLGRLITTIGVKNMMCCGMVIGGVTTASFGCIQFIPLTSVNLYTAVGFGIRTLQSLGTAAIFTSVTTSATIFFPENSTAMLSLLGALGGVGMMSGPGIGGGLFALGGFWVIFVSIGGLMFVMAIFMFFLLPNYEMNDSKDGPVILPYGKIFLNPRMLISLSIGYFSAAKWAAIDPILEPQLRHKFGLVETQSAMVFLLLSGAYVIATPIAGKMVGQAFCMDSLLVMIIGLIINMAAFLFAGPSPLIGIEASSSELWVLLVCLCVMGATNCLLYVPAQDIIFNIERLKLPEETNIKAVKGLLSGIWMSMYSSGFFTGMTLSGILQQYFGWEWTMTVYAGGCVLFMVVITAIKLQEKSSCCASRAKDEEQQSLIQQDEGLKNPYSSNQIK